MRCRRDSTLHRSRCNRAHAIPTHAAPPIGRPNAPQASLAEKREALSRLKARLDAMQAEGTEAAAEQLAEQRAALCAEFARREESSAAAHSSEIGRLRSQLQAGCVRA